jgi:hypothetical protein
MFDLKRIQAEIAATPLLVPFAPPVGAAMVDDCARLAGSAPCPDGFWEEYLGDARRAEQMGALAHFLAYSSLRDGTIEAICAFATVPQAAARAFFEAVAPLDGVMLRENSFRREEFLRRWIACWGGAIEGETMAFSQKRLEQLDYRKALVEYERAEVERKKEASRRAAALAEAQRVAQQDTGWRE